MNRILIALAMSTALVTGAAAADLGGGKKHKPATAEQSLLDPVPAAHEDLSWTRLWGFVGGGYGMTNTEFDASPYIDFDGLGGQGAFGEVQLGFDKQFGIGIVGVEIGGGYSDSSSKLSGFGGSAELALKESYFVGGRLGYAISPSAALIGSAGWRWENAELTGDLGKWDDTLDGWYAALSLEGRANKMVGWKVFGRYTDFQDPINSKDVDIKPAELQIGGGLTISLDAERVSF